MTAMMTISMVAPMIAKSFLGAPSVCEAIIPEKARPLPLYTAFEEKIDFDPRVTDSVRSGETLLGSSTFYKREVEGAKELEFETRWEQTRIWTAIGPTHGDYNIEDYIGLSYFSGEFAPDIGPSGRKMGPGSTGNQSYRFSDTDGLLSLVIEPIDMSGFKNRFLSFQLWIANTRYDPEDKFVLLARDPYETIALYSVSGLDMNDLASPDDGTDNWLSRLVDLDVFLEQTGFDERHVQFIFAADVRETNQNIFIDEIVITGQVPPPAGPQLPPGTVLIPNGSLIELSDGTSGTLELEFEDDMAAITVSGVLVLPDGTTARVPEGTIVKDPSGLQLYPAETIIA
eukprot:GHVL01015992.1.p1 GENE.GHVL01015992.1~~GHVL01015992.1.p1  ORF type:complete len:342 (+),score=62.69 GHVL01015992.1:547-1572(+)